jgi:hypothetical protein
MGINMWDGGGKGERTGGRGVVGVRGTAASRYGDTRIFVTADSTSPQGDKNVSHFPTWSEQ